MAMLSKGFQLRHEAVNKILFHENEPLQRRSKRDYDWYVQRTIDFARKGGLDEQAFYGLIGKDFPASSTGAFSVNRSASPDTKVL